MSKKHILASAAIAMAGFSTVAAAQPWPAKPIKLIVPFSVGGPTDALARQVAKQLNDGLGQSVIVENVLGAAGQIGLEKTTGSPADGYTIVVSANTIQAIAPHLRKLPYDPIKGFTPLGGLAGFPYGLTVKADSPINSVQQLVARAKASPGTVSSGSAGVGTGTDLTINMLAQVANVSFNQVTYKGSAPVSRICLAGTSTSASK